MARFYAEVSGKARTQASRLGVDEIRATVKSWQGEVNITMWRYGDKDLVHVTLEQHGGGETVTLYNGPCEGWRYYKNIGELGKLALDETYNRKAA